LFPLFGFYKNFSLMAAFLGMGIGLAVGRRRPIHTAYVLLFLVAQLVFFLGLKAAGWHHWLKNPVPELLAMGLENTQGWTAWSSVLGFLCLSYFLTALTFYPLGQLAGGLMARLPGLKSYGLNLVGSLAGVAAFTLLSHAWLPPGVWFAFALVPVFAVLGSAGALNVGLVVAAFAFTLFSDFEPALATKRLYSPYQAISIKPTNDHTRISVSANQLFFQNALDLSRSETLRSPSAQLNALRYEMAYQLVKDPSDVLIVGSGTGNDVAAALRRGAKRVDAVEIDPLILQLGRDLHPEKPYADTRVKAHTADARAFVRSTPVKYDAIVYGLLDSHTLLSGLGGVRLDTFVYTVEAFREARLKLKEGGVLALNFCLISRALGRKLYLMLAEAFDGEAPMVFQPGYDGGVMFLAGPGTKAIAAASLPLPNLAATYAALKGETGVATDDKPYFYLVSARYPVSYALVALALALLSLSLIGALVPGERRAGVTAASVSFCFLGAGFMLLQMRAISQWGLWMGTTWEVAAAVVGALLALGWAANAAVSWLPRLRLSWAYLLLAASLAGGWWLQGRVTAPWLLMASSVLPVFFSGVVFSVSLRRHPSMPLALAANLFGAVLGGLVEYHSMLMGLRGLYVLAFLMYAGALVSHVWKKRPNRAAQAPARMALRRVGKTG
jgi:spermidine synthase